MDSYRGFPAERQEWEAERHGADPGDDDIGREPPPVEVGQDERRMQVRAYTYWSSLLGDRDLPRIADMAAAGPPDFADHAVILDFSEGIENPAMTMLGRKLAEECGAAGTVARLSDVPGGSLLSRITDHCRQILANRTPIGFEAEFVSLRGTTLLYRGILLPFSSDGTTIDHVLGVINWKEVADPVTTGRLARELDRAFAPDRAARPFRFAAPPPPGEWADGPLAAGCAPAAAHAAGDLAAGLAAARDLAALAAGLEESRRAALHLAIGRAWDVLLAARAEPEALAALIAASGPRARARSPIVPVVKLLFGAAFDTARQAEIAAALAHAGRCGVEQGMFAAFLAETPGGLGAVAAQERRLRRAERAG